MDDQQKRLAEELLFTTKKKQGFAKQLYSGIFDATTVFPFPEVSEEEKNQTDQFLKKLEEFSDKEIDPVAIDRNAEIPEHVLKGLGKLGVLGMTIPKEYGGLGMSQYAYCKAVELLASKCGSTALFVNAHQSIGLKALLLFGTAKQKEKWLPPLAKGEIYGAFSLTELNAGSDANGIETKAVFDSSKNVYRINGKKQWTTNGSIAGVLTVMAKTEIKTPSGIQERVTAFLVTPDMKGFNVTASALEKVGFRGTKTANLEFIDMEVPADNVLGPIGGGLRVCLTVLDYGRTTFGATCTGGAKFLLKHAIEHSRNRYQFKRPLCSFGLVKKKIAKIAALTYAIDASTYLTAGFVDAEVEEFMLESAMLKVFSSDALWEIIYETMQIYGGRSFFVDQPFERMMRDARLNMIGEGANEVMRAFIGLVGMRDIGLELKDTFEQIKKPFSHIQKLFDFGKKHFNRWRSAKVFVKNEILRKEAKSLERAVQLFGIAVVRVLAKYREDVLEKQLTLDRIASCAMALYTMSAVLSKIDSELSHKGCNVSQDLEIAKHYCGMAMSTFYMNYNTLFDKHDDEIERLADRVTGYKERK